MEKYFIVTEESSLHEDYLNYLRISKVIHLYSMDFLNIHNIKAIEFCPEQ